MELWNKRDGDGFSDMGTQKSAIKLVMAST